MSKHRTITFQQILEVIESLPDEQQESLIDILKHRLIEYRREKLAESIKEARAEYNRGEVKYGTLDDLMKDLNG